MGYNDIRAEEGVSRRKFLMGGALLASSAVIGAGLAGCSPSTSDSSSSAAGSGDTSWDKEADIVVVGTGTVAVAAMAASHYGAGKIIVLEKTDLFGGTTIFSGQGMGIPLCHVHGDNAANDTMEAVLEYYKNASGGRADLSVGEAFATNGDRFVTWMEETYGMTFGFTVGEGFFGDYYDPVEGYLGIGRNPISVTSIEGENEGTTAWTYFNKRIMADENTELLLGTPATSLVTDENGAVIGVVANDGSSDIRIKANKAVILGTGGFEHNAHMRQQYLSMPLIGLQSCEGNTGDGHKMGMKVGADVAYMDRCWGLPHVYLGDKNPREMVLNNEAIATLGVGSDAVFDAASYRGFPGSVVVNAKGRRIGNECSSYDTFNRSFGVFDSGDNDQPNIESYLVFDATYVPSFGRFAGAGEDGTLPEAYVKADSLEELADKLGIEKETFVSEMAAFNENASQGVDPVFHRGEHEYDINTTGGFMAKSGRDVSGDNPVLSPVSTPPFYGVKYVPGTFGTNGGLRIDAHSQVLSVDGEPIAGLYAVGNCSSGVAGGCYAHGGFTVGSGSVMSWVAVRHILGIED
ncbi:FAD-dependent oxidoreductase [Adlercreutzia sp. ZJ141]|uniref:FAD-dependent oxidoreductase n=1 Tax=Adlercreutzia sp. ZJ141 TaxID=2709406 RepID=UPI0013EDDA45|nr:FAD-binding protein [Adlercreutzia sp. ZJ141]